MSGINPFQHVCKLILRRELLPWTTGLVVGVSGGTDSLALMHLLMIAGPIYSIQLHIATLDHGLRGDQGADDARFVAETARAWGFPVTSGNADVRAFAQERRIGIEAAARIARYDFLASVAAEVGAARIAVAHNADDQVETVLLHLLRGSGLAGLGGMAYVAPLPGHPALTLLRPILDVSRTDLDAYCLEHGLQPRHDATNEDVSYTRNRLRRETLPYLRDLSPQIERNIRQLADIAHVEDDFADVALHQAINPYVTQTEGRISLPRAIFVQMHPALQRRFILWAARRFSEADDVAYLHITAAVDLALTGQVGARALLTGGVQLRIDYQRLIVEYDSTPITTDQPLLPPQAVIPVVIPGVTQVETGWSLETSLTPFEFQGVRLALPEGATVVLRGRREGDQIASLGLHGHHHKISKWMIYWQVPRELRERVPLLEIDGEIGVIWWRPVTIISEKFSVTDESPRVVYFKLNNEPLL